MDDGFISVKLDTQNGRSIEVLLDTNKPFDYLSIYANDADGKDWNHKLNILQVKQLRDVLSLTIEKEQGDFIEF